MTATRFALIAQGGHADGLRAVPFIRALRQNEPDSRIVVLGYEFAREFWSSCPYVDGFAATGDDSILGRGWRTRMAKIGRIARLAPRMIGRFDVFINLEVQAEGGFPGLLSLAAGVPVRVGHGGRRKGMNRSPGKADMSVPYEDRMAELLKQLGVSAPDLTLEAWCSDADRSAVRAILERSGWRAGRRLVVCHAGSDWSCQTWAASSWVAVARHLGDAHGAHVVFTGTAAESARIGSITQRCGAAAVNLSGKTSFVQLCALVELADLVISGDTLVAPLAVAMRTPAITLTAYDTSNWSPSRLRELNAITRFEIAGPLPWSARCHWNRIGRVHTCESESCVGIHGMGRILPVDVLNRAVELLGEAQPAAAVGAPR